VGNAQQRNRLRYGISATAGNTWKQVSADCGSEGRGFEPRRSHGAIAKAYDLPLRKRGHNSELYLRFMRIAKRQCEALPDKRVTGQLL